MLDGGRLSKDAGSLDAAERGYPINEPPPPPACASGAPVAVEGLKADVLTELDYAAAMPAVAMLRTAGEDDDALEQALAEISAHILPLAIGFAGERHDMLSFRVMKALCCWSVGLDALAEAIGRFRVGRVWRRFSGRAPHAHDADFD